MFYYAVYFFVLANTSSTILFYYRPQRSCGKVFTPVCHSVHRGWVCLADTPLGRHPTLGRHPPPGRPSLGGHPIWADTTSRGKHLPPPADGNCSGRYASYWNAFLFNILNEFYTKYSTSRVIDASNCLHFIRMLHQRHQGL